MNFSNDKIITDNKILTFLVKKIKNLRKSFCKSNNKISSDDIINNNNLNRTLSESKTSSSKIYSKSNSTTYSIRDKSLDLIRIEPQSESDQHYNIDTNLYYEIVLPYQRYSYKKN